MNYFLVFGLIGTALLSILCVPLYLFIFRKAQRAKLWHAIASAGLFGFGYSALIFLVEGEASTAIDTTVGFAENLQSGLPLYLLVFTFFSIFMTSAYAVFNVILLTTDKNR